MANYEVPLEIRKLKESQLKKPKVSKKPTPVKKAKKVPVALNLNPDTTTVTTTELAPAIETAWQSYYRYLAIQKRYSPLTLKSYKAVLTHAFKLWQQEFASQQQTWETWQQLGIRQINNLTQQLYNLKLSAQTIRYRLIIINGLFNYLVNQELINSNPLANIKKIKSGYPIPPKVALSDVEALLNSFDHSNPKEQRNGLIFELIFATGLRLAEVTNLKVADLDLAQQQIKLVGKGNKTRIVPLTAHLISLLKGYLKDKNHQEALFKNDQGHPLTGRAIQLILEKQCKKIKIPHLSPHKLRHCFATQILINSSNLLLVQQLLGHARIQTTQVYTNLDIKHLITSYNKFHPLNKNTKS